MKLLKLWSHILEKAAFVCKHHANPYWYTVLFITNQFKLCICNFSIFSGCDFNFSIPITAYSNDLSVGFMLNHELQPAPITMNLTIIKKLCHPHLTNLLQQVWESGWKTLITVHHDVEEIHLVLGRVKKDGEHWWWKALFGWPPTATGTLNQVLHPIMILLTVVIVCLLL